MTQLKTLSSLRHEVQPIVEYLSTLDDKQVKSIINTVANWGRRRNRSPFPLHESLVITPELFDQVNSIDFLKKKRKVYYYLQATICIQSY